MFFTRSSIKRRTLYATLFLLCTLLIVACNSTTPSSTSKVVVLATMQATQVATVRAQPLTYSCQLQQTPILNGTVGQEVHGKAQNAELWALLQGNLQATTMIKIVWRMTGDGMFSLTALGPQGKRIAPSWGPDMHNGSNWNKPGDEWGAGFVFPTKGCWDIHATRGNADGDVWLNIAA